MAKKMSCLSRWKVIKFEVQCVRQKTVKQDRKVLLKKNLILFENVDMIEPDQIRWDRIRYQRNNQSYRMLMNICYLVLGSLLLSTDKGETKLAVFWMNVLCTVYMKSLFWNIFVIITRSIRQILIQFRGI